MGDRDDPMAVVDPECRVIGIDGLRVADSSILPHITYGNLNGPSIMTGEKAADNILGKQTLPRSNQQPWINPRAAVRARCAVSSEERHVGKEGVSTCSTRWAAYS